MGKNAVEYTNSEEYTCLEDLQKDLVELNLLYCGWERCESGYRYGPNRRKNYVLHVIKEGKGTLELKGKIYHLQAGDVFVLRPVLRHGMRRIKHSRGFIFGLVLMD